MEDREIVELFWRRDESAIRQVSRRLGAYLMKIARNVLGDPEDCREVVNDTYLAAWNTIPPHRPEALDRYLGKIVREKAIDRLRGRERQRRAPSEGLVSLSELEELLAYLSDHEEHDGSDKLGGGADIPGETAETVTEGVQAAAYGGQVVFEDGVPSGVTGGWAYYVKEGALWTVPLEGGTAEPVETGFPVEELFLSGDVLAAVGVRWDVDMMELRPEETVPEGPEGPWVKVRRFRLQEGGGLELLGDYLQSGEPVALYLQGETLMVLTTDGECACGWSRLQDTSQYIPWALDGETLAVTGTDTYAGEGSLRLFDVLWQEDRAVLAVNEVQVRGYDVESFDHLVTLDISGEAPAFADTGLVTDEVSGVEGLVGYGSPLGHLESLIPLGGDTFMRFDGVPRGFDIFTLEGEPRFLCRSAGELPEGERFNFDWTLLGNNTLLVEHLTPGPDGRIAAPTRDYRLYRVDPGAVEPLDLLGEYPTGIPLTYQGLAWLITQDGPAALELS